MKAQGDKNICTTSMQAFTCNYDQTTKSFYYLRFTRLFLFLKGANHIQVTELYLSREHEIRAFQHVPLQLTFTT